MKEIKCSEILRKPTQNPKYQWKKVPGMTGIPQVATVNVAQVRAESLASLGNFVYCCG